MGFEKAYNENHTDFEIEPVYEDDAEATHSNISFEYSAPAVSVDTKGRFVQHKIIGGTTVRQKVGEDPIEVKVSGVCRESVARKLDTLRDAKYGTIYTGRLPGDSLTVQFASTTTSPMEDSGAVSLRDAKKGADPEFLYTFDLSCVEVNL